MFALGTYTVNTSDDGHSELATSIDHTTAMTLLNMVNDGSPIVRKVGSVTKNSRCRWKTAAYTGCLVMRSMAVLLKIVAIGCYSSVSSSKYECFSSQDSPTLDFFGGSEEKWQCCSVPIARHKATVARGSIA